MHSSTEDSLATSQAEPASSSLVSSTHGVKAEPGDEESGEQTVSLHRRPLHFTASDFLTLWRHTAAPAKKNVTGAKEEKLSERDPASSQRFGTLTIGAVVFAPCRVETPSPLRVTGNQSGKAVAATLGPSPRYRLHYALAEVTGIQVMAGTVTVSFLCTDPGVDDEAVSLYECIPCPPTCLARWLHEESDQHVRASDAPSSVCCSLLERLLHVAPDEGPLPVNDIYRAMVASSAVSTGTAGTATRLTAQQAQCAAQLRDVYCLSGGDDDEDEDGEDDKEEGKGSSCALQEKTREIANGFMKQTDTTATAAAMEKESTLESSTHSAAPDSTDFIVWEAKAGSATATSASVLSAHYAAPTSLHVFFARVFQTVNARMELLCSSPPHSTSAATSSDVESTPSSLPPPALQPWRCMSSHRGASARAPPVILVLFDSYAALRRFHVFMTVRGHVVQLQDGTASSGSAGGLSNTRLLSTPPSSQASETRSVQEVCRGGPPPTPRVSVAFGTACKVWLCMLRDDTGENDSDATAADMGAADARRRQLRKAMEKQLRGLLASAPPIDGLVTFKEHEASPDKGNVPSRNVRQSLVEAEDVLRELLPHLRRSCLLCHLHGVPTAPLRPSAAQGPSGTVVKVSGAIFGDRKLLLPCSPEQLTLLASVLAGEAASPPATAAAGEPQRLSGGGQKRPRAGNDSTNATQALTPALLERIALGSFTDTAAAALFDAFADAAAVVASPSASAPGSPSSGAGKVPCIAEASLPQHGNFSTLLGTVEDVYEKLCVDPSRFGEAFPVFQAVYALVADVFRSPTLFRRGANSSGSTRSGAPSALPRVALVLPRGNPTRHPSLSTQQFLHTLRLFFTPWTLHEVSATTTTATATAAPLSSMNACVLWYQRGGLLLLFCDEATTQLGALQDDADVVVACGRAAAAWVAANAMHGDSVASTTSPVYFAVISEVEVVAPADHAAHLWLPITLPAPSPDLLTDSATAPVNGAEPPLQWPSTPSLDGAVETPTELAVVWERLLRTVGADGNPVAFTPATSAGMSLPSSRSPQAQPVPSATSTTTTAPGRRWRHVSVLPKTLRQAVVLWRHLSSSSPAPHTERITPEVQGADEVVDSAQEKLLLDTPWRLLRTLVKNVALACATTTPVLMSDVALVRHSDTMSQ